MSKIKNYILVNSSELIWLNYPFLWLFVILVLRNGINFWGYDKYALEYAKKWPEPVSVFSVESSGNLALAKLLSIESRFSWMALHVILTIAVFLILIYFISKLKTSAFEKQTLFYLILCSSLTMLVMQEIGFFDVLTILGAVILAFGNGLPIKFLGSIIMCSGNTPQALIATFLLGAFINVVDINSARSKVKNFYPFFVVCICYILQQFWLSGLGRISEFKPNAWIAAFHGFLIAAPLFLYALLGPVWCLSFVIWEKLQKFSKKQKIYILVILLIIPGIFGIITVDSTRDTICIMAPTLLWFFKYLVVESKLVIPKNYKIALAVMPCFLVSRYGQVTSPWEELGKIFFSSI